MSGDAMHLLVVLAGAFKRAGKSHNLPEEPLLRS